MPLEKKEYIANCIHNLLEKPCDLKNERQRCLDIADALLIAEDSGAHAAHNYLLELLKRADAGRYVEKSSTARIIAQCKMCEQEIEHTGKYWQHVGEHQPRHPAVPSE